MWSLCLVLSIQHSVFSVHVIAFITILFFLWLNNILYRYATYSSIFISQQTFELFFTFWLLSVVLPWTFLYKFLFEHLISILRYILWSGTPGSYDNSLTNWRTTKWFSTVVAPCIFPSVVDENCYIRVFQRNKIIRILRQMFSSRIIYFQLLYLSHCCIFN